MKINTSVLAAALGMASVSLAGAQTYVYMTGSTAARDAVFTTITNGSAVFDSAPQFTGSGSTTPGSCSYMNFSGLVGGQAVVLKCAWSGSEAGISDVANAQQELFMDDPSVNSSVPAYGAAPAAAATGLTNSLGNVSIAQADNAVAYSQNPGVTVQAFSDSLAIPFVFVKNTTTIADQGAFGNITDDNFKNLVNGGEKLGLFTGNNADTAYVYLAGRDNNSGTRVNVFDITGFGSKTSCKQIELTTSGTTAAMSKFGTPSKYQGIGGQSSGGTLAKSLLDTTSAADSVNGGTGFIAVAYLGLADRDTALGISVPVTVLAYNGVYYTAAAVANGTYALWGNEYTILGSSYTSGVQYSIANSLVAKLQNNTSGYEIPFSQMNVTRTGPTANPVHK